MLSIAERRKLLKIVSADNERLVEVFDTLSDANRCKLFRLVGSQPDISVSEAAATLALSMPLASQHFKTLVKSKMLSRRKVGREVRYKLNLDDPLVEAIVKVIKE